MWFESWACFVNACCKRLQNCSPKRMSLWLESCSCFATRNMGDHPTRRMCMENTTSVAPAVLCVFVTRTMYGHQTLRLCTYGACGTSSGRRHRALGATWVPSGHLGGALAYVNRTTDEAQSFKMVRYEKVMKYHWFS